jgi:hypothetical protein
MALVHPDQNTFPIATMAIFKIPRQARETSHKNIETPRQFTAFTLLAKTIPSDGTSAAPFRGVYPTMSACAPAPLHITTDWRTPPLTNAC